MDFVECPQGSKDTDYESKTMCCFFEEKASVLLFVSLAAENTLQKHTDDHGVAHEMLVSMDQCNQSPLLEKKKHFRQLFSASHSSSL